MNKKFNGETLDQSFHIIQQSLKKIMWNSYSDLGIKNLDKLSWYYAEDRLYVIKVFGAESIKFVVAESPKQALLLTFGERVLRDEFASNHVLIEEYGFTREDIDKAIAFIDNTSNKE